MCLASFHASLLNRCPSTKRSDMVPNFPLIPSESNDDKLAQWLTRSALVANKVSSFSVSPSSFSSNETLCLNSFTFSRARIVNFSSSGTWPLAMRTDAFSAYARASCADSGADLLGLRRFDEKGPASSLPELRARARPEVSSGRGTYVKIKSLGGVNL